VLADHHPNGRFDVLQNLAANLEFLGLAELRQVASEQDEVGLRVAVKAETREEAEKVRRACSNLWIMGPGGTSFGTPMKPRPVIACWPTLVPRSVVQQHVEVMEV